MKKSIMTVLLLGLAGLANAQDFAKDYQKMIRRYDVPKEARWIGEDSPSEFWTVAIDNNVQLAKFDKDIKKGKGAEKEALREELRLPHFYPDYDPMVVGEARNYCDSLLRDMGIGKPGENCKLCIVNSSAPNVFSVLTDDGFAICVTESLFRDKMMTDDIMKGYVAREYAHGVLKHRLRNLYTQAKDKRLDRILGGVAFCVTTAAVTAIELSLPDNTPVVYTVPLDPSDSPTFTSDNVDDGKQVLENLNDNLKNNTLIYTFDFSPGQIYEADLMAFRFLQNIGKEDAFFDGLKILGARYDSQFATLEDHPTIAQRISFMEYVKDNPGYTRN